MVDVSDIGWGRYRQFEGPYYLGKKPFNLDMSAGPTEAEAILAVITATEGGNYDAYNGYDRCICSSGLIQWCEAGQFSVSKMLGHAFDNAMGADAAEAFSVFRAEISSLGYSFNREDVRFVKKPSERVKELSHQQRQFLLNSDGRKGSWDGLSRNYAKRWAAAISTFWENPGTQESQRTFTVNRLGNFALPYAKRVFDYLPDNDVTRMLWAAYLSFAANNPTWANAALRFAIEEKNAEPSSLSGAIEVLKQLTFHKGITIYPHRYKAIRPVLERLYGVDLPDFSSELRSWNNSEASPEVLWDVKEVQAALLYLGHDLGPKRADGVWGHKTSGALLEFERQANIPEEFIDGKLDKYTAPALAEELAKRGRTELIPEGIDSL